MKHEAWISRDWEKEGMTWVVVARERAAADGWLEVGAFLVDGWCLGVKDAYADEMDRAELDGFLDEQLPSAGRESLEPACARKLIEGAAAYAQGLGFLPHREYRKARKVLGGLDGAACAQEFAFGREGRPCFVAGPDDDEARVNRVLAVLTGRFGDDGFDFVDDAAEPDEGEEAEAIDEVIEEFYRYVESGRAPSPALTSFEANGFLAGLRLLPEPPDRDEWMPELWGGAEFAPAFADNLEKASVLEGILCRFDQIEDDFAAGHFFAPLPSLSESDHVEMAARYCRGLQRALGLRPKILAWLRGHPETAAAIKVLEELAAAVPVADDTPPQSWRGGDVEPGDFIGERIGALFACTRELRRQTGL